MYIASTVFLQPTKEVRSSVHGDCAIDGAVLATTTGGIRVQSRKARVNASNTASGNSAWKLKVGSSDDGKYSTTACVPA